MTVISAFLSAVGLIGTILGIVNWYSSYRGTNKRKNSILVTMLAAIVCLTFFFISVSPTSGSLGIQEQSTATPENSITSTKLYPNIQGTYKYGCFIYQTGIAATPSPNGVSKVASLELDITQQNQQHFVGTIISNNNNSYPYTIQNGTVDTSGKVQFFINNVPATYYNNHSNYSGHLETCQNVQRCVE